MSQLSMILIAVVAFLHLFFLIIEMFLWTKPYGMKAFQLTPEKAEITKVMAMNQGLYNGFLAAGLFWSLVAPLNVAYFFLGCVFVAGVFGAMTASRKIFYIQALPALIALISLTLK